jgi:hypothetical protein
MSGYPGKAGEVFPNTPLLREYRNTWLTRRVEPAAPGPRAAPPGVVPGEGN